MDDQLPLLVRDLTATTELQQVAPGVRRQGMLLEGVEMTQTASPPEEATPRRRSRSSRRDRGAAGERRQRRDRGTQSAAAAAWDPARKYPPIAEVIEDTDSGRPGSGSWRAAAAIESLGTYVYKPPI